ncbi:MULTISPECIES: hypothetical protein [Arthrobacter]|nr:MULTISPECIES: hypothetical protein [Arthrobacter]
MTISVADVAGCFGSRTVLVPLESDLNVVVTDSVCISSRKSPRDA